MSTLAHRNSKLGKLTLLPVFIIKIVHTNNPLSSLSESYIFNNE